MQKLTLDKDRKYILTCSFGPDSMCLFELLLEQGYDFVVAHVNFHLREEEQSEVAILKRFCEKNNIKIYIKDFYMPVGANEEGWARTVRYDYFSELSKELKIEVVLIAHNEDDLLETFLLQKARGNLVSFYGLKETSHYKECIIVRPLLKYKKSELQHFCDDKKVPYGIDKSNFDVSYKRNKIRKEIVKDMDRQTRDNMIEEIVLMNSKQDKKYEKYSTLFLSKTIPLEFLKPLSKEDLHFVLIRYFDNRGFYHPISKGFVEDFILLVKRDKNWHRKLAENVYLEIDYGELGLYFVNSKAYNGDFLKKNVIIDCKSNCFKGFDFEKLKIKNKIGSNVLYVEKGFKKRVGRCFIDWKVPYVYRLVWPGVFNENGELIYLPRYQKDFCKTNKVMALDFSLNNFVS